MLRISRFEADDLARSDRLAERKTVRRRFKSIKLLNKCDVRRRDLMSVGLLSKMIRSRMGIGRSWMDVAEITSLSN